MIQQFFWGFKRIEAGSWRDSCTPMFHGSIIPNSQKVEATQVSTDVQTKCGLYTWDVIQPLEVILNIDEPWSYHAKWSKSATGEQIWYNSM